MSVTALTPFPATAPLPAYKATASGKPWVLRAVDEREALAIAQAAGVDMAIARVLAARGVKAREANAYLNPSLRTSLPDPFVLRDMDKATARLAAAVLGGEKVGVFGDYDVDGTSAAAILKLYFDAVGSLLEVYLPDRLLEGYGPSIEAFRALAQGGARVVVTVDCGAAAHAAIEAAAKEGMEIVVLDHHLMQGPPPDAVAVVNPNRLDDASGLKNLSAAGLAFMAVVALNRALRAEGRFKDRPEPDLRRLLDVCAVGLVCDVMPMTGLARILVAQGLKALKGGGNPGLAALASRCALKGEPSTYHLGFLLGPRLNAAGRIGHARLALELLTTDDDARRASLADKLNTLNAERQAIEERVLYAALAQASQHTYGESELALVAGEGWHPGVIGIVAGRLKESLERPAIVVSIDGAVGKGSGRSLAGVDLGAAINAAKAEGLLLAGGGHAMAAGLTVAADGVGALTEFLNARLGAAIAAARAAARLDVDAALSPIAVSAAFAADVARAGPFGPGNPEPVFVLTNVRADFPRSVGNGHLSCLLVSETGERAGAVAFRPTKQLEEMLRSGARLHVAGKIRADDWRGGEAGQLHVVDVAEAF